MTARDQFLQRIHDAVRAGNHAQPAPEIEPRGPIGYQGASPNLVDCLRDQFTAAGGIFHRVDAPQAAAELVVQLAKAVSATRVLLGTSPLLDSLGLATALTEIGATIVSGRDTRPGEPRDPLFAADLAITGVDAIVAESGTLAIKARASEPRSFSLLPPVHIVVAEESQVVPDLFDLFASLEADVAADTLPSCLTLVTGPSKTGDIELKLVTGVHGPGELHLVLIAGTGRPSEAGICSPSESAR